jgi:Na+/H+ antiporter NhaD/arsenite permease-like protein
MTDILVVLSLAGIAIGRIPSLRMNRATIALVGATLLVLSGALSLEEAYRAIDANTVVLLFAMMAFNANLRMAGFFALAGQALRRSARGPRTLLLYVMALSALLSALLINDTAVLMLTPIVLDLALGAGLNPLPYIIGLALSANIGSMATIIGNPQNILIGTGSGIGFFEFSAALLPPALALLALAYLILLALYPKDFKGVRLAANPPGRVFVYKPLLIKCGLAFAAMVLALLLGLPVSLAGLAGAALLLVTRRIRPERVFMDVDWSLLVLFPSLFVITRAAADSWLFARLYAAIEGPMGSSMALLGLFSAGLSQFISNVPAVMLLMPLVAPLPDARTGWLVLAACTTVAGNLSLLGSVANLIVAELAQKRGVKLGFWAYSKAGTPVALVSVAVTLLWLLAPR